MTVRDQLIDLSKALRQFHSVLLEHSKREYELKHEPISSPFAYWQLVVSHPHFSWLRPLSGLMGTLDEVIDTKGPLTEQNVMDVHKALAMLFSPLDTSFVDFRKEYQRFRDFSDVKFAEARWRALIEGTLN